MQGRFGGLAFRRLWGRQAKPNLQTPPPRRARRAPPPPGPPRRPARSHCYPRLSDGAREALVSKYVDIRERARGQGRDQDTDESPIPITVRRGGGREAAARLEAAAGRGAGGRRHQALDGGAAGVAVVWPGPCAAGAGVQMAPGFRKRLQSRV
jgi:hypothetical protein